MTQNKVWLYCRIANVGVLGADSIEMQRRRLEWYAARHDMKVVGYSEDRQPGLTMKRPGVLEMNRAVEQHKVDIVLVFNLDRLCRKIGDAVRYWHYLHKHGVRLCSVSDGEIDLSMDADIMGVLSSGAISRLSRS